MGDNADATVDTAVMLGNEAVEAAFVLGNSQTGQIIKLKHENKELRMEVDTIKKDGGISRETLRPEEFEKQQNRWEQEIKERDEEIQSMKNRLSIERPITKEIHEANATIKGLSTELDEYKKKYGDSINAYAKHKNRFGKMHSTLTKQEGYESSRTGVDNSSQASSEGSVDTGELGIEIGILRIRLHLNKMVQQRGLHGMQEDDASTAVEIARDRLEFSQRFADESAIARVSFWLGIALYYSDQTHEALTHFEEANKPTILPAYEADLIQGWLERCRGSGPEKDGSAYRPTKKGGIDQRPANPNKKSRTMTSKKITQKAVTTQSGEAEVGRTPLHAPGGQDENAAPKRGRIGNFVRALPPSRWLRSFRGGPKGAQASPTNQ